MLENQNNNEQKISIIVGARPNFIKAFPVYEALKKNFKLELIHTGQHFDEKMSKVFFEELSFPKPDVHFDLLSNSRAGELDNKLYTNNREYLKNIKKVMEELISYDGIKLGQLGEIRDKLKNHFEKNKPDLVIVFGDVTSTLSASLACKILDIKIAHVESGLRSGDLSMPEEVNRILTDNMSEYFFVTEQAGVDNLKKEGITENVFLVGNTMIDTQKKHLDKALNTKYNEKFELKKEEYILFTLHRPCNVDNITKLKYIFDDLFELSKKNKIFYPIHPRTKINLEKIGYLNKIKENKNIILDDPVGYLEFTCLIANCKYLITDSGGLQEESTALNIPCFTLRENTERPCTLIENQGTNQLIHKICDIELKECKGNIELWDGKSSERIMNILKNIFYKNILICFGTRPEYIKVKSLIDNLKNIKTCFTGQHNDLLKNINVDYKLLMEKDLSETRLNNIFSNIFSYNIFNDIDYVMVQGDTSTACAIAISAFNHGKKIIHLEAGLRSKNLKDPYPEEMNRQVIGRLADIHLCPTRFNKENLLKENVSGKIYVVGNTGLDNILKEGCEYGNQVLITMHRRDNHHNMDKWFQELEKLANKYHEIEFIIPLHLNPNVQKHKGIFKKVRVVEPMSHNDLIEYLKKCKFVISDSGGLQEECSYLNKKIIVCRKTTERPESIGIHSFMCIEPELLEDLVDEINNNYEVNAICPYGNGKSWDNINYIFNKKNDDKSFMKILLYGAKGWIGGQFINILDKNNINYIKSCTRVDNNTMLEKEIKEINPTHIISFIGRTHGKIDDKIYTTIDYLEQEGKLLDNVRDNLYGPLLLSEICKKNDIHFTYLGTGCIFKYDENHLFGKEENGFDENSLPNFFGSSYSTVKGFTDRLMKLYDNNVLNLRIRMPIIGEQNLRNFITKITTYDKICSIPNSMTVLPELLPFVLEMMIMKKTGTINLTNPGLISHNEILDMFKEIVDPNFTYKNFSLEEQRAILESDRSNNFLDTTKLQCLFPQVKNIKDSVKEILIEYKNSYIPKIITSQNEITKIKCLFITGGFGFIGSNFINIFCNKYPNIKIINFDALYYCSNKNNVDKQIQNSKNYVFIEGNLQSFDLLKYIFQTNEISHIIHFAAQSHVQNSFNDSLQYTKDNVLGTHNLLEVNRLYNKNLLKFIHVSTDEVYGESMIDINEKHKTEQSVLCPTNPYAASKAAAELIAQSYNHSFNMPIIITRGNNVYGPNQYPEKLVPQFIKQLKNNKKVTIQGDGSCIRAFLHVYDTVSAFETILLNGKIGEIYNIGCDEGMEYSVMEVAKMLINIIKNTNDYDEWIEYIDDRPFNDKRYYISNKKVKELGWKINVNFKDGINNLIDYYTN